MELAYKTLTHKTTGYTSVLSSPHRTFTKIDGRLDNKTRHILKKEKDHRDFSLTSITLI